jgi:1-acyl-sn-glycerol-3-phosphate acyltransferase
VDVIYEALQVVVRPVLRHGFDWTVEGEEHIPEQGGVILAANHISYLDALCVAYAADLRSRRTRFLAKATFFDVPVLGFILRGVGDIPVGVGRAAGASALDSATVELAAGHCLGIFPEGMISRDLEPRAARTGVARLAAAAGVPVVPFGLWGTHRLWAKGRVPRVRPGVAEVVAVGKAVTVSADEDPRAAADRVMAAICAQVARAREIYPQRPRPGSSPWWHRPPETARPRVGQEIEDE